MQAKKQQLEWGMKQCTGSKLVKKYVKAVCCHPGYLTSMQSTSHEMMYKLDKAQDGIKIARRNINNLRYADDTTLMAESREEQKIILMKTEKGEQKSWHKTQQSKNEDCGIKFHHFMANGWGKKKSGRLSYLGLQNHCRW